MKSLVLLLILLIPLSTNSSVGCGVFSFKGIPKLLEDSMVIVIHEGTQSEHIIHVPSKEFLRIAPYIGIMTSGEVTISQVIDEGSSHASLITQLNTTTGDSYLEKKQESVCK